MKIQYNNSVFHYDNETLKNQQLQSSLKLRIFVFAERRQNIIK